MYILLYCRLQSRSQDFPEGGGFFGSLMQPKTNLTQIFIILKLDSGGFLSKLGDLKKKKVSTEIQTGFSGRNQKFKVFFGRMQVIFNKKKVFPEIQRVFPAEIRNSNQIFSNLIFHYARCNTPKHVTRLLGLSPRHCALATQLFWRNIAAVASRWQHCVRFDRPEI